MVRKKYQKKEIVLAAGSLLLGIAILTFYLWHQAALISLGYETARLEEQVFRLGEEIKELETKKTALLALDRVERIAREDLYLAEPSEGQVIFDDFQVVEKQ